MSVGLHQAMGLGGLGQLDGQEGGDAVAEGQVPGLGLEFSLRYGRRRANTVN